MKMTTLKLKSYSFFFDKNRFEDPQVTKKFATKLEAGGKPSTWFPPEGLVEHISIKLKSQYKLLA